MLARPTLEYDLRFAPLSFDLITALALMRVRQLRAGLTPGRFDVIVNRAEKSRQVGVELTYDSHYVSAKTRDVIINVLANCNWVGSFAIRDGGANIDALDRSSVTPNEDAKKRRLAGYPEWMTTPYSACQLEEALVQNFFPLDDGFVASSAAVDYACRELSNNDVIVIHPRYSKISPERNTPPALFLDLIEKYGAHRVVVVPDHEDVLITRKWAGLGCKWLPEAALNIDLRIALAQRAKINILWNGGNIYPLHFSSARFISFGIVNPNNALCSIDYFKRKGPRPFVNPIWLRHDQELDWTSTDNLTSDYLAGRVLSALN